MNAKTGIWKDDTEFREWLLENYGDQFKNDQRPSVKTMSNRAQWHLFNTLRWMNGEGEPTVAWNKHTPAQYGKINELKSLLNWTDARMDEFIQHQTRLLKSIEFLTWKEASKVITGMERTLQSKQEQRK